MSSKSQSQTLCYTMLNTVKLNICPNNITENYSQILKTLLILPWKFCKVCSFMWSIQKVPHTANSTNFIWDQQDEDLKQIYEYSLCKWTADLSGCFKIQTANLPWTLCLCLRIAEMRFSTNQELLLSPEDRKICKSRWLKKDDWWIFINFLC